MRSHEAVYPSRNQICQTAAYFYSCRCSLPVKIFCIAHLGDVCILQLSNLPRRSGSPELSLSGLKLCCHVLEQTRQSSPFIGPLLKLLAKRAEDEGLENKISHLDLESILDACTRPTHSLPIVQMVAKMDPGFSEQWSSVWNRPRASSVTSLLNTE